jgi:hypothetical protein
MCSAFFAALPVIAKCKGGGAALWTAERDLSGILINAVSRRALFFELTRFLTANSFHFTGTCANPMALFRSGGRQAASATCGV